MFPPPPPDQVKQTPRSGMGPGSINGFVLVIGFFHNTPAAAHPKLVTYFALVSQSHCSLFSVIEGDVRIWQYHTIASCWLKRTVWVRQLWHGDKRNEWSDQEEEVTGEGYGLGVPIPLIIWDSGLSGWRRMCPRYLMREPEMRIEEGIQDGKTW